MEKVHALTDINKLTPHRQPHETKTAAIPDLGPCDRCNGKGSYFHVQTQAHLKCKPCGGSGRFNVFSIWRTIIWMYENRARGREDDATSVERERRLRAMLPADGPKFGFLPDQNFVEVSQDVLWQQFPSARGRNPTLATMLKDKPVYVKVDNG